jgi:hypothetical protein
MPPSTFPSPPRDCVANGIDKVSVMLNLFQHLIESICYETLKRVQGDEKGITTHSPLGRGKFIRRISLNSLPLDGGGLALWSRGLYSTG